MGFFKGLFGKKDETVNVGAASNETLAPASNNSMVLIVMSISKDNLNKVVFVMSKNA